jgi:hypothetical protein
MERCAMVELKEIIQEEIKVNSQQLQYLIEMNFDPSASVTASTEECG